jgi:transcriptional regulator with XRE-family HTH domain
VILKLMTKKGKREVRAVLPPPCVAVKTLREAYGDTLEKFAQRIGISMTSASRFELGKSVPRDPGVLGRLRDAASDRGLENEVTVFRDAILQKGDPAQTVYSFSAPEPTLKQWRIGAAVRILTTYYPEHLPALMEALAPALRHVDAALRGVGDPSQIDYRALDRRLIRIADQQVFLEIQQEPQQGKKDK